MKKIVSLALSAAMLLTFSAFSTYAADENALPAPAALYEFNAIDPFLGGKDTSGNGHDLKANWCGHTMKDGTAVFDTQTQWGYYYDPILDDTSKTLKEDFTDTLTNLTVVTTATFPETATVGDSVGLVASGWDNAGGFAFLVRDEYLAFDCRSDTVWTAVQMTPHFYRGTHTYAAVYDRTSSTLKLYFDGTEVYSGAQPAITFYNQYTALTVGATNGWGYGASQYGVGFDYAAVYDAALSAEQITAVDNTYNQNKYMPAPTALYEFKDPANPGLDTSGKGNHIAPNWPGVSTLNGHTALDREWAYFMTDNADDFIDDLHELTFVAKVTMETALPRDSENYTILSSGIDWEGNAGFALFLRYDGIYFDSKSVNSWVGKQMAEDFYLGTHTYAVSYDRNDAVIRIYFDDTLIYAGSHAAIDFNASTTRFGIGALVWASGDPGYYMFGYKPVYDYVAVYDDALTLTQIKKAEAAYSETNTFAAETAIYDSSVDGGFVSAKADGDISIADAASGKLAFTVHFNKAAVSVGGSAASFGVYIYKEGNAGNPYAVTLDKAGLVNGNDGYYVVVVEDIPAEYFGTDVYAVPFIQVGETIVSGTSGAVAHGNVNAFPANIVGYAQA